jgi:hypothetical protein
MDRRRDLDMGEIVQRPHGFGKWHCDQDKRDRLKRACKNMGRKPGRIFIDNCGGAHTTTTDMQKMLVLWPNGLIEITDQAAHFSKTYLKPWW